MKAVPDSLSLRFVSATAALCLAAAVAFPAAARPGRHGGHLSFGVRGPATRMVTPGTYGHGWGGFGGYGYGPYGYGRFGYGAGFGLACCGIGVAVYDPWHDPLADPYLWMDEGYAPFEAAPPPDAPLPAPAAQPAPVWYYCPDSKAYYPYVSQCGSPWQEVAGPGAPR